MKVVRRLLVVLAAVTATVLGTPTLASAHAELESTTPAADSVLASSPDRIVLTFSEQVNPLPDSLRLLAADGSSVTIGDVGQAEGSDSLTADVPTLAEGTYAVAWRAVSADSHVVNGAFIFSVRTSTGTAPGLLAVALHDERPNRAAEAVEGIGKGISWFGMAALVGGSLLILAFMPSVCTTRRYGVVLVASASLGLMGAITMIVAQAWLTIGKPFSLSAWRDVLTSASGRWWFARVALLLVALACVLLRHRLVSWRHSKTLAVIIAFGLIEVTTVGGHALSGRWRTGAVIATFVHVAAMCAWIGGLVAITTLIPRQEAWSFAKRFSPIAFVSVFALAVSGVFNAWRQGLSWADVTATSYGRWLVVKLAVVIAVVTAAGVNRWLVAQPPTLRAVSLPNSTVGAATNAGAVSAAGPSIRRIVGLEMFGALLIFAATAGLTGSAPPASVVSAPGSLSVRATVDARTAQIVIAPPSTGRTHMDITIIGANGGDQPQRVTVTATLPAQNVGPLDIPMTVLAPGHLVTDQAVLPIPGDWTISIAARYGDFDLVTFTAVLSIR